MRNGTGGETRKEKEKGTRKEKGSWGSEKGKFESILVDLVYQRKGEWGRGEERGGE